MELTWTTEKSEKELAALVSRLNFRREMFLVTLLLSAIFGVHCGVEWFRSMLYAASGSSFTFFTLFLCCVMTPCVAPFLGLKINEIFVLRVCRKRKTNRVEYRLTDDTLAFTVGETEFSLPWNKVATHYRLEDDVLFLKYHGSFLSNPFGKKPPFEAQCIPEWKGRGVGREELVAALEKAGLKKEKVGFKKASGKLETLISGIMVVVVVVFLFLCLVLWKKEMSVSWQDFRWRLSDVELRRTFFQIVEEDARESENPYFNYWENHGNFVQRFATRLTTPFGFEKYECIYQDDDKSPGRKVGIAVTVGDWVLLRDVLCGQSWRVERAKWEKQKSIKVFPYSARAEWLEKVRPLVPELRKAEQDRLLKGNESITTR